MSISHILLVNKLELYRKLSTYLRTVISVAPVTVHQSTYLSYVFFLL